MQNPFKSIQHYQARKVYHRIKTAQSLQPSIHKNICLSFNKTKQKNYLNSYFMLGKQILQEKKKIFNIQKQSVKLYGIQALKHEYQENQKNDSVFRKIENKNFCYPNQYTSQIFYENQNQPNPIKVNNKGKHYRPSIFNFLSSQQQLYENNYLQKKNICKESQFKRQLSNHSNYY